MKLVVPAKSVQVLSHPAAGSLIVGLHSPENI
jgi:hypothetical protein